MDCPEWFHWVTRLLVIAGAGIGGAGASRTVRRAVRNAPNRAGAKVVAVSRSLADLIVRFAGRTVGLMRRMRLIVINWLNRVRASLGLSTNATVDMRAVGAGVATATATLTVTPGPLPERVASLEEWRSEEEEDRRIEARWLVVGFSLIALGEFLDLIVC